VTKGEGAISDDEARAMFGLPPREEDEGEEAARAMLGVVGDGNGTGADEEIDLAAVGTAESDGAEGTETATEEEEVSAAE